MKNDGDDDASDAGDDDASHDVDDGDDRGLWR